MISSVTIDGRWRLAWADHAALTGETYTTPEAIERSGLPIIEANVPGNFEKSLFEAGIEPDPYFGTNALRMQAYENKHVWYYTTFALPWQPDTNTVLRFEGIDTYADIYVNGTHIASVENMLIPHELAAPSLRQGKNEVVVHIHPAVLRGRAKPTPAGSMALKYNVDSLQTRKSAHMYGWDIFPRIVSCGIWRSVSIVQKAPERIDELFLYTTAVDARLHTATLSAYFLTNIRSDSLADYRIVIEGVCGESRFRTEQRLWHTAGRLTINVDDARLWWPKNAGEPALYAVTARLYKGQTLLDTRTLRTGLRIVELDRTSLTDQQGSGEFCFRVNGKRVFMLGTNWVGTDAFPSQGAARLPRALELLDDIGCNMVRIWGGSLYEADAFYDLCDEKGILIWQDFAMACGIYPQDADFQEAIRAEVECVVKRLRNHASIGLWAGDNECDYAYADWSGVRRDPNRNLLTRHVIPQVLEMHDFTRPYLPSSPYIDETAFREGRDWITEDHLWGPRDYYKGPFYAKSPAHFASEIGYHGCPAVESIRRFISPDALWPWQDNAEWMVHAASPENTKDAPYAFRIALMANQIRELFGKAPETLEEFVQASQLVQAEAFKHFIEQFRSMKWRRTGILWWNLLDGWPQFSDAIVDYYFRKKLAYGFIKRAQEPLCLFFADQYGWKLPLLAANDTPRERALHWRVRDIAQYRVLGEGRAVVPADSTVRLWEHAYCAGEQALYLIEWELDGREYTNHYLSGSPAFDLATVRAWFQKAGLYEEDER